MIDRDKWNGTKSKADRESDDADGRYGAFGSEGATVVYDTENPQAWVKSDGAVALDARV